MADLFPSERGPGLLLGDGVEIPDDVVLGGNVVIHSGVRIGAGAVIQDGAIIGKPLALGAHSTAAREAPGPASIGPGTKVCAGAVVVVSACKLTLLSMRMLAEATPGAIVPIG